jgi:4-amino-4-deoxy-L-arabinose transferase-like glycosyltransferase
MSSPKVGHPMYQHIIRVLAIVAIVLGIGARVFDFGHTPPGLNQDEAAIGYEAWCLLHYGMDRNGVSWPVHLISWGSGQNALYAYLAMPFVSFGLSPLTTRLPMLISALASLPLIWLIARRLFDEKAAWSATALAALSPWHIMLSRWGLESNLLPFVFLCGLACLVVAQDARSKVGWLTFACALFSLSLYAYGSAYVVVPIFLFGALLIGIHAGTFTIRHALIGLCAFALLALPIALFVAINTFQWDAIVIADVTIPRLPTTPRFQSQLAERSTIHAPQLWQLLVTQRDGSHYNVTDPYGVLYSGIFLALAVALSLTTIVLVVARRWPQKRALVGLWLIACIPTGLLQQPNINRVNLLLMALVFAAGLAIAVVDERIRGALIASLIAITIACGFFARDYFTTQRAKLSPEFFEGLVPALQYKSTCPTSTRYSANEPTRTTICTPCSMSIPAHRFAKLFHMADTRST